jgi:fucose permease
MSVVWLSLAVFFFVSGMEATAGNWAFTLFTEGRGETIVAAGQWVSAYWASFTAGRVLFGLLGERLAPVSVLRGTMLLAMLGAGLLWWHPTDGVSYLGLVLFGLALAPMFPLLILETPRRVGKKYADQVIGFQIGVAGLGLAALPALAGVLADRISLEIVPPFVVIGIVILIIFHETVLRRGATS